MRVSLTWRQIKAVHHWATERHQPYLAARTTRGKIHDVAMPPAAWHALADILEAEAFSSSGRGRPSKLKGAKAGTRSALHTISRELLHVATHPALRGEGVVGCSSDFLCVWPVSGGSAYLWSPEPVPGTSMQILVPHFDDGLVASSGKATFPLAATFWIATEPDKVLVAPPDAFKDEQEHLGWVSSPEQ